MRLAVDLPAPAIALIRRKAIQSATGKKVGSIPMIKRNFEQIAIQEGLIKNGKPTLEGKKASIRLMDFLGLPKKATVKELQTRLYEIEASAGSPIKKIAAILFSHIPQNKAAEGLSLFARKHPDIAKKPALQITFPELMGLARNAIREVDNKKIGTRHWMKHSNEQIGIAEGFIQPTNKDGKITKQSTKKWQNAVAAFLKNYKLSPDATYEDLLQAMMHNGVDKQNKIWKLMDLQLYN